MFKVLCFQKIAKRILYSMLLVVSVSATRCSFLTVQSVQENHTSIDRIKCTSTKTAPIIDTVGAIFFALNAIAGFVVASSWEDKKSDPDFDPSENDLGPSVSAYALVHALVSIPLSLTYVASAAYGYHETSKCAEARRGPFDNESETEF